MRLMSVSREQILSPRQSSPPAQPACLPSNKPLETPPAEPLKPKSPWSISRPSQFEVGPLSASLHTSPGRTCRDISPLSNPIEQAAHLISREIVHASLNANEEFLERRRQARLIVQGELGKSISSIEKTRARQTSRQETEDSHASRDSIFGLHDAPLSLPLSEHRTSLAITLHVPGFGAGVEDGIEAVENVDHDDGLMLASENQVVSQAIPTTSIKSVDHPMRHDCSFYKFGGFCEGAKAMMRGEAGFTPVKRIAVRELLPVNQWQLTPTREGITSQQ